MANGRGIDGTANGQRLRLAARLPDRSRHTVAANWHGGEVADASGIDGGDWHGQRLPLPARSRHTVAG
jgi:hypothetical protein